MIVSFSAPTPGTLLLAMLSVLWLGSEVWIHRLRAADRGKAHDAGTLQWLRVLLPTGVIASLWMAWQGIGMAPERLRLVLFAIGCTGMLSGIVLRIRSVQVLDRFFTIHVAIHDDHELIRHGPYRCLRHPSYTGALCTFLCFPLALGTWAGWMAMALLVVPGFLYRIRVEERALRQAFPQQYPAYARSTKRLIPFVW